MVSVVEKERSARDPFGLAGRLVAGKYRVTALVGEGGFGVVYRGVHEGFQAPVAIKCLKVPPHLDAEAEEALVSGLRREGRLLLQLSQKTSAIVQALDVGTFTARSGAEVPYLVLEWLEGRSLADECRRRRREGRPGMSLRAAIELLEPVARALAVAHAAKIAHRDIKPENLFLVPSDGSSTVKLLDFGIAKVLSEATSPADATTSGLPPVFTPSYGAPEQFDKRRGATGPWTDVFALALVLVELVAGRRALEGEEFTDFLSASLDPRRRPTLRAAGVAATGEVEAVLERALHVEPAERYLDAGRFWDALNDAVSTGAHEIGAAPAPRDDDGSPGDASVSTQQFVAEEKIRLSPETPARTGVTTRAGLASGSSQPPMPRARRPLWVGAIIAIVAAGSAAAFFAWPRSTTQDRPPEPSEHVQTSAAVSQNAEAAALYREALEAWRGGAPDDAVRTMARATAVDRELAAGQLRLAVWKFSRRPVEAREHYDIALRHIDTLGAKDRSLLEAVEPMLRQPWDLEELDARLGRFASEHADDAEPWVYLAAARLKRLHIDEALEAVRRARDIDPASVGAWVLEGECLAAMGDARGQLAAYGHCLEHVPRAVECLNKQVSVRAALGDCGAMRDDAQRLAAMNPRSATAQRQLALALHATGGGREAVLEALTRKWALFGETERKAAEASDRAALATAEGDFDNALHWLAQWLAAVNDRPDQTSHAAPAFDRAAVYVEMGEPAKAADATAEFSRRMAAWSEPTEGDWTLAALRYDLLAGRVSRATFAEARTTWMARVRAKWDDAGRSQDDAFAWSQWAMAWGAAVETEGDAREASATMPPDSASVLETGRWLYVDFVLGKTRALAGDFAAAKVPLLRAANSCSALSESVVVTSAAFYLGLALEGLGDRNGARAAYERVVERWGRAKPRSVTAEKARTRLRALGRP